MFVRERVPCLLNGFAGHGDDVEAKELKLVFHITPISQELAHEIAPHLADRLFRRNDENEWTPVAEMPKASFASINVQMQNITFYEVPEGKGAGIHVPGCAISNLRAARAFAGGLDFRLEFDVVVPMDGITMRLVEQFYKATCFLSMEEIQRQMEYQEGEGPAAEVQGSLQDAADSDDVKMTLQVGNEEPIPLTAKQLKRAAKRAKETANA